MTRTSAIMQKTATSEGIKRGRRISIHRPRLSAAVSVAALAMAMALFFSCGKEKATDIQEDVLFSIDGKTLTLTEVEAKIPVGIEPMDSAALFDRIVDSWIESALLSQLAESKLPDLEEIEKKVENYRNRLIAAEYMAMMRESQRQKISQDSVRAYYDAHKKELLTESPLVKGVYIKVASSSAGLDKIRELVFRWSDNDIDELEKNWMESALQYDYFGGTWVDWQTIADQIPHRFSDPDAFLEENANFETTYNGSTYLLHISEHLPSGSEQPFEFASGRISAILEQSKMASFEDALVRSLMEKAVNEERLEMVNYDPLKRSFIRKRIKTTNNDTK